MAKIRPFRALHPVPALAAKVASVPYDVVSTDEARALAAGNPDSFLHVTRPEIGMPQGTDPHDEQVYAEGRKNLDALRARGTLVQDDTACIYLYRLTWEGQSQTGIVAGYSVEEYDQDLIKKHEFTRPDKEEDRTVHVLRMGAQAGPVFLTFRPDAGVSQLMDTVQADAPWIDFTTEDGVGHTLWRVPETAAWLSAFERVNPLYVADGHHRSASASNVRKRLGAGRDLAGDDVLQSFLAVAFPSNQVRILAYNRVVTDLGSHTAETLLDAFRALGPVVEDVDAASTAPGDVRFYLAGHWYGVTLTTDSDDPVERLGAQMLQRQVFEGLLGVGDPRTDSRLAFVGGIRGAADLARRVDSGEAAIAFSLFPVTPDELLSVADAGRTMPPKSTWFEPKLRSGLCTYLIEGS